MPAVPNNPLGFRVGRRSIPVAMVFGAMLASLAPAFAQTRPSGKPAAHETPTPRRQMLVVDRDDTLAA